MRKFAIAIVTLGLLIACLHRPAAANVTSATLSSQQTSYNGACPAAMKFAGTIVGTAGTSFKYTWNRFINGVQSTVDGNNGNSITLTAQQTSYAVNDSIPVSSNASGNTFDQIWVHNISGGQSDVYSNKITFSVTCWKLNPNVVNQASPTPTPKPKFGGSAVYQAYHTVPAYLQQTKNPQDCGDHGGGFACNGWFPNGDLVLIWCYGNGPQPCKGTVSSSTAQLFRIYEVGHGQHTLINPPGIQAYNDGTIATVGGVPPPNGGFTNQCYMVVAVDQGKEYGDDTVCLSNGSVGQSTTVLHPSNTATRSYSSQYGNVPFRAACAPVCVGWQHDQSSIIAPNIIPIWWYADNYRGYYKFDLSSVMGTYVLSATLKIPIDGGDPSCFSGIAQADSDWTNNTNFVGGAFINPGGSLNFGIDVTDIVRSWINGNPNNGFVLRGRNENLVAESTTCLLNLDDANAELDITHS